MTVLAINQAMNTNLTEAKVKTESNSLGINFTDVAREAVQSFLGEIVIAQGEDLKDLRFRDRKFEFETTVPKKLIETPYDLIARVQNFIKKGGEK